MFDFLKKKGHHIVEEATPVLVEAIPVTRHQLEEADNYMHNINLGSDSVTKILGGASKSTNYIN